jgi:hypothetical protein
MYRRPGTGCPAPDPWVFAEPEERCGPGKDRRSHFAPAPRGIGCRMRTAGAKWERRLWQTNLCPMEKNLCSASIDLACQSLTSLSHSISAEGGQKAADQMHDHPDQRPDLPTASTGLEHSAKNRPRPGNSQAAAIRFCRGEPAGSAQPHQPEPPDTKRIGEQGRAPRRWPTEVKATYVLRGLTWK